MQVTAHLDPETGLLFQHEKDFKAHVAKRRREAAAEARRQAALAQQAALRATLSDELETLEQLPALARKMYEGKLATYRLRRGKEPLTVVDFQVRNVELSCSEQLRLDARVVLSGIPEKTYNESFIALSPHDVLHPFSLRGAGGASADGEHYSYYAAIGVSLDQLPKLRARFSKAAKVLRESYAHQHDVQQAIEAQAQAAVEFQQLDTQAEQAYQAILDAQARYAAACEARRTCKDQVAARVRESMPFARQEELTAAEPLKALLANAQYTLLRAVTA